MFRGKLSISSHIAFSWIRYYKNIESILSSTVNDPHLLILNDAELLEKARAHFRPKSPWNAQIRPDHLERCRVFMDAL
jgi:hypothetical protein